MDLLLRALEAALVLVMLFLLLELLRLRRALDSAAMSLSEMDEARRLDKSALAPTTQDKALADELAAKFDDLSRRAERMAAGVFTAEEVTRAAAQVESEEEPEPAVAEPPTRRGPRVLSEAGRAKYDSVLRLAAQGLDAGSIAEQVDLTRAEVEMMLGADS